MKKTWMFIVIIGFLFSGCSLLNIVSLSPPDWILGTWSTNTGLDYTEMKFKFTTSNCVLTGSGISIDFLEAFKKSKMNDSSSDTNYSITVSLIGADANYSFQKITSTSFNYYNTINGISIGPLVFFRQ